MGDFAPNTFHRTVLHRDETTLRQESSDFLLVRNCPEGCSLSDEEKNAGPGKCPKCQEKETPLDTELVPNFVFTIIGQIGHGDVYVNYDYAKEFLVREEDGHLCRYIFPADITTLWIGTNNLDVVGDASEVDIPEELVQLQGLTVLSRRRLVSQHTPQFTKLCEEIAAAYRK